MPDGKGDFIDSQKPEEKVPAKIPELIAGAAVAPIVPRSIDEVGRVAQAVMVANMVPSSYDGPDQAAVKSKLMIGIMKGLEIGMGPITALSTIMVVNNRPCVWGDGAVALAQRHGALEWAKHRYTGTPYQDDYTCHVEIKRRGQAEPYRGSFSVAQAKKARLWANPKRAPWMDYPDRMLFNRARAFALRDGFADCLMGLSIAEEVMDLPAVEEKPDTAFLDDGVIIEHGEPQTVEVTTPPTEDDGVKEAPNDWQHWMTEVLDEIKRCKTDADRGELRSKIAPTLDAAPAAIAGRIERELRRPAA